MTVAELIEVLKTMPQDAYPVVYDKDSDITMLHEEDVKFHINAFDVWNGKEGKFICADIVWLV